MEFIFVLVCLLLIGVILIQKGRGGGMSSAFGGGGGNTAFGTKTGDVLTWATSIIFALFITIAVVLNLMADKIGAPAAPTGTPIQQTGGSSGGLPAAPTTQGD
jgi:preprotein translocase subunit SecG